MKTGKKLFLGLAVVVQLLGGLAASERKSTFIARDHAEAPAKKSIGKKGKHKAAAAGKTATSHRDLKMHRLADDEVKLDDEPSVELPLVAPPPLSPTDRYAAELASICSTPKAFRQFVGTGHTLGKHANNSLAAIKSRALTKKSIITAYANQQVALQATADNLFTNIARAAAFLACQEKRSHAFYCDHGKPIGYGHNGIEAISALTTSCIALRPTSRIKAFSFGLASSYPTQLQPETKSVTPKAKSSPVRFFPDDTPPAASAASEAACRPIESDSEAEEVGSEDASVILSASYPPVAAQKSDTTASTSDTEADKHSEKEEMESDSNDDAPVATALAHKKSFFAALASSSDDED